MTANTSIQMTVVVPDRLIDNHKEIVPYNSAMWGLDRFSVELPTSDNLFVFTSATGLPEITRFFPKNEVFKVLFVWMNCNLKVLLQRLKPAEWQWLLRSLDKIFFYSNLAEPQRILAAWEMGATEQLIAKATVLEDSLLVTDCALQTWEIPFQQLPILAKLSRENRAKFEIDEDGSYLYWPSGDIHLDMEALRAIVDPELRDRLRAERAIYDQKFGEAVAAVRKAHHLKETDIPGILSDQIRRIEKGDRPKLETLRKLSQAHGLTVNEYMEEIAATLSQWRSII